MAIADPLSQEGHAVRFDWGPDAARRFGGTCAAVVIVDVLSFTTAVSVAAERGASVLPWGGDRPSAAAFARDRGAVLADRRGERGPSLSPASLATLGAGSLLVLPSPNGSTCCALAATGGAAVATGSLRNRHAVAAWLRRALEQGPVAVIAAGEQWPSGALRPAMEDLVGAGAILSLLDDDVLSPEARVAVGAYRAVTGDLAAAVRDCGSARELVGGGFAEDVDLAVELDVTDALPVLRDGALVVDADAAGSRQP